MNEVTIFLGYCGHRWIGLMTGSYQCPVCGAGDGDHNIRWSKDIPLQTNDFQSGYAWFAIAAESAREQGGVA